MLEFDADETPIFLSVDWRNNSGARGYCVVSPRAEIVCETLDDDDTNEDNASGPSSGFRSGGSDQRAVTLEDCLRQFMQPEVLSREEAWYCPE